MRKPLTEEEKADICQLYQDGRPAREIAMRYGRTDVTIYKIVNSMGLRRRTERQQKTEQNTSDTTEKKSVLKKPWYLSKQNPNNQRKAIHE